MQRLELVGICPKKWNTSTIISTEQINIVCVMALFFNADEGSRASTRPFRTDHRS
jgi:hypothetical protein